MTFSIDSVSFTFGLRFFFVGAVTTGAGVGLLGSVCSLCGTARTDRSELCSRSPSKRLTRDITVSIVVVPLSFLCFGFGFAVLANVPYA